MKRIDAIKNIIDYVNDEDVIVSSCGHISREVFFLKDRSLNFYVMGSMSASLGVAIGVALNTKRKVVVIAGDGEILMNLGTLVVLNKLQRKYGNMAIDKARKYIASGDKTKANNIIVNNQFNLDLYILDNGQYESTGGQDTCSDAIDFRLLCKCKVVFCKDSETTVPRITMTHKEIKERFMNAIRE